MKYHNAIELIQDAIDVLGDTLQYPDVQRKFGFEELRQHALDDVLYLAAKCPDQEHALWNGAMSAFGDLNLQLAELNVAPLRIPTYGAFLGMLEDWHLNDTVASPEDVGLDDGAPGGDFFQTLLDSDLNQIEQANRVIARITEQKHRERLARQPAPTAVEVKPEDKGLIENSVRLACRVKGFEHLVFELLLVELGEKNSWRFEGAAEEAWRLFFADEVAKARIEEAA
ncbi:hypothetical protein BMW22_02425 [Rhizobium leguminosarum]|uniref:Uncharacterized protein n=1 Tax=Rhizobium leguminosarum TaxID=384 RepID=A0A1L3Z511_RHILE|nr:hypothetical protein [Rhizobium leguminosarum]API50640.1 hypothetical protein BMW22_02425 [Rhizobium leguminosarum]